MIRPVAAPASRMRAVSLVMLVCGGFLARHAAAQSLAAASGTSSNDDSLPEVVVTARFRAEKLQETPLAITALSAAALEERGVMNVTDLSSAAPNLIINPGGAGFGPAAFATIRGIGMNDFSLALEPGVAIYIDDVYQARPLGAAMDLLDLDRVEVLRGPQGTLFGQNAIGGAIRLISRKPNGADSGYLEVTGGNLNRREVRGGFDLTLIPDRLFARFSGSSNTADGYMTIYDFACVHPDLAGTIPRTTAGTSCKAGTEGDTNIQAGRAALRFVASDSVELNLIADYENQRQEQPADKLSVIATTGPDAGYTPIWNATVAIPTYGVPYDSRFVTNSPYSTYNNFHSAITGLDYPNANNVVQYGLSGTIEWQISKDLSLKSISAGRHYDSLFGVNSSGSPEAINMTVDHDPHQQFSEELTLTGTTGPLEWTVGGYYYRGRDADWGTAEVYPPDILAFFFDDEQRQTSKAGFIHGVYHLTDKWSVTAGVRFTDEDKSIRVLRQSVITEELLFPITPLTENDRKWSPMGNIAYQWTQDLMTYAQASTGFRGGGFSPRPNDQNEVRSFGPETLTTYELGIKSSWLDHRIRLNGAAFYSKYAGIQLPSLFVDSSGIIATVTENVGRAHIEGLELELEARLVGGLLLNANAGYLHYKNDDLGAAAGISGGATLDTVPPRTPAVTASAGAEYAIPLGSASLTPRLDATYQSKVFFDSANTELGSQGGYVLLNGRVTWTAREGGWSVAWWGTNLTNKVYATSALNLVSGFGTDELSIAPPREWGVSVRKKF